MIFNIWTWPLSQVNELKKSLNVIDDYELDIPQQIKLCLMHVPDL